MATNKSYYVYTTDQEIEFLRRLYERRGPDAIRQYRESMRQRVDWGDINPALLKKEIERLLSGQSLEQLLQGKGVVN